MKEFKYIQVTEPVTISCFFHFPVCCLLSVVCDSHE